MRQPTVPPESDLSYSLEAFRRARLRRAAAEDIEQDLLRRVLDDAMFHNVLSDSKDQKLSLRQIESLTGISRPTLARKRVSATLGAPPSCPSDYYDEDERIAAEDAAWGYDPAVQDDRGPWKVEPREDGTRAFTRVTLGVARLEASEHDDSAPAPDPKCEPLTSITFAELDHLKETLEGSRSERILRRFARAVLRTLHPGMPRIGIILDAAIEGVKQDLPGAMVLTDQAIPLDTADQEWVEDLRTRRARGFYLPRWDQDPIAHMGA